MSSSTKAHSRSPLAVFVARACLQEIPDAREAGLAHLCEFIEDCEFTFLSVQVLHVLGQEAPTTKEPSR